MSAVSIFSCSSDDVDDDDVIKFKVIRTSDALRKEVSLPLSTKLSAFKASLATENHFGLSGAPVERQRIFYMGRELKSGGRSLASLGLGKFDNNVLHLHIRPGFSREGIDREGVVKKRKRNENGELSMTYNQKPKLQPQRPPGRASSHRNGISNVTSNAANKPEVVNLLDSDDEEEEEEEEEDNGGNNSSSSSVVIEEDKRERRSEGAKEVVELLDSDSEDEEEDNEKEDSFRNTRKDVRNGVTSYEEINY
mmetsp:Transcript_13189/g.24757  ORF Transcript_13189/g.24757 Transcript_13189/m.24757 type:complete len:251 (+) Transcript_13189:219-971(+)